MATPPKCLYLPIILLILAACADDRPAPPTPPLTTPVIQVTPSPPAITIAAGLQPGEGAPPVRLVIPSIDLDTTVVPVGWQIVQDETERRTEWQAAAFAAGHHLNSANVGEVGNVVLSGHHNTQGAVFRRIAEYKLKVGDRIILVGEDNQPFTYVVTEITDPPLPEHGQDEETRRLHGQYLAQTDEPTLTLVTCWPLWTNTHRIVVVAKLIEATT